MVEKVYCPEKETVRTPDEARNCDCFYDRGHCSQRADSHCVVVAPPQRDDGDEGRGGDGVDTCL